MRFEESRKLSDRSGPPPPFTTPVKVSRGRLRDRRRGYRQRHLRGRAAQGEQQGEHGAALRSPRELHVHGVGVAWGVGERTSRQSIADYHRQL